MERVMQNLTVPNLTTPLDNMTTSNTTLLPSLNLADSIHHKLRRRVQALLPIYADDVTLFQRETSAEVAAFILDASVCTEGSVVKK